ncbi:MAG: NAD-dependent epimerase/dehydratase family protein [Thaumarchaeota archaeon]|nr:NAD-dependent epimerase/dehydratase family protein [Nitrososphaerota archaeon]
MLVTGSEGFVGKHVVNYLSANGFEPIGTDVARTAKVVGSIVDKAFVDNELSRLDFEAVVHLAGIADLNKTIEDPYSCYQINCFGTLNALELASKKGVSRFLFASSANVYGAPKDNPVGEEQAMDPRVPYDYSKVIGEKLVMSYYKTKGLPVAITRAWLLFGEFDHPNRAVPFFIRTCLKNEPLKLFNSGRDVTAPSHAANFAKLVSKILDDDAAVGEAFNFGGGETIAIRQLAERVKRLTHSDSELQMLPPRSQAETEPQVSYPSTDKMKRLLHYDYDLDLDEGLRRTIDWIKKSS